MFAARKRKPEENETYMSLKTNTRSIICSCGSLASVARSRIRSKTAMKSVLYPTRRVICALCSRSVVPVRSMKDGRSVKEITAFAKGGSVTWAMRIERAMDESIGVVPSSRRGLIIEPETSETAMQRESFPVSWIDDTRVFHCASATSASTPRPFAWTKSFAGVIVAPEMVSLPSATRRRYALKPSASCL